MPNQKSIKELVTKYLTESRDTTPATAGIANGQIKKIIIFEFNRDSDGSTGNVAVFYKNCQTFTNYQNVQTQRPCEFFSFSLEYTNEDDCTDFDFWLDETDFFDSVGSEWQEKISERTSDSEFVQFWM